MMTKRYKTMRFLVCYTLLAGIGGVFIFVFGLYEELGLFNRIDFNHQQSMFFRLKAVLFFLFVFFTVAEIFFVIPVLCLAISILVIKIKKSIFSSLLEGGIMENNNVIGIDLAKTVFQIHIANHEVKKD